MPLEQLLPEDFDKLGVMGWPLLACSLFTLLLILERFSFFALHGMGSHKQFRKLSHILHQHRETPKDLRDEIISLELSRITSKFSRGIGSLRLLAAIAPLLGLLGTILGIISAFQVIAVTEGPVTPNLIADGLWEALLTTAAGLIVALPAIVSAGLFAAWKQLLSNALTSRLNSQSIQMELEQTRINESSAARRNLEDRLAS
ncbi:MotA/TolQ/ExbB proton channel family protein [Sneathiella glossodoripedis]|uniref:MotA/TolQ/ExbB proton channel family protein n=1 Tax=Sneathiella glossodoripedis TaxID=418853 RepID=UPI00047104A0|nr:MotA/TolQ/ExbB proton channel family protein [Sneathiella glossodoripedis]